MVTYVPWADYDAGVSPEAVHLEDIKVPIYMYVAADDEICTAEHAHKLSKRVKAAAFKIREDFTHETFNNGGSIYTTDFLNFVNNSAINGMTYTALAFITTLTMIEF